MSKSNALVAAVLGTLLASHATAYAEPPPGLGLSASAELVVQIQRGLLKKPEGPRTLCHDSLAKLRAKGTGPIKLWTDDNLTKFGMVRTEEGYELSIENAEKLCTAYSAYWVAGTNAYELKAIAEFVESTGSGTMENGKRAMEEADRCVKLVDEILAAGVPGSNPFVLSWRSTELTKTLDDVKPNVCERKRGKGVEHTAAVEAEEAPYRKVLKADKLDIALDNKDTQFFGSGKRPLKTPADMAKANLWIRHWVSGEWVCRNGQTVHTVRRYKFNAKHVWINVDDGDKTYCGLPPASAFK